jgi:hypothetical protein
LKDFLEPIDIHASREHHQRGRTRGTTNWTSV